MKITGFITIMSCLLIMQLHAQDAPKPANTVLKEALIKAGKENKKVFLIFHASWCGWCHTMENTMNNDTCKPLFDSNYITTHITVMESPEKKSLENAGGDVMLKKYHGEKSGIPFWLIFDAKGNLLSDSQIRPEGASLSEYGENVGCPVEPKEIAHFIKVLKQTSTLNQEQLNIIREAFSKNKQ